ncbi:MAG: metallophosphoesterase family protein [Desulfotignum sp.]|nr:metallophosphoesterase family protein [Desulfotignum sp.]
MRVAVISDIHSNMEALEAVEKDMRRQGVAQIISLGDNIGYGPEPGPVIDWLRSCKVASVMGNHEKALVNPVFLDGFYPPAKKALLINKQMLSKAACQWIATLPFFLIFQGARFVHGMPPDMNDVCITSQADSRIIHTMHALQERICFVGHTHVPGIFQVETRGVKKKKFEKSRVLLANQHRYIINTGSVGQPRDGYNKAKYVIWDMDAQVVELRSVSYDIHKTVAKIKASGIPLLYADLLEKNGDQSR